MSDHDKELDEILKVFYDRAVLSVGQSFAGDPYEITVRSAKAKLSALLRRVEVEGRKDQVEHDYWAYRVMWADDTDMVESAQEIQAYLLKELEAEL